MAASLGEVEAAQAALAVRRRVAMKLADCLAD